ncbi:MAG TPA: AEC family transporter [Mobilitalea sp.]|nr:AEC family transporter [Mobilitalea sp.]
MRTLAETAFNQIAIMFLIIIVGVISYKMKLIDKEVNKKISDLVLMLVNPIVIFISYQREFNSELLKGLLISLVLAVATHMFSVIVSMVLVRKGKSKEDNAIERFAVVYSNCGYIGIPLVNGILGSEGVFYLTAYITIFNLVLWTHGVILMTDKKDVKSITKAFLSPAVIATFVGFLFFVAKISIPGAMLDSLTYIGNMNTPLPMLVAGATIAQTDLRKLVTKLRIYYITFLKLIFIPLVMLLVFQFFPLPKVVLLTSVLAAACPTAVTINLFSIRYEKNYFYASELFTAITVLSIVTIPFVMAIAGLLY